MPDDFNPETVERRNTILKEKENSKREQGVFNDLDAAKKVYKLYPHWVFCKGILYVFDDETGLYSNEKSLFYKIISRYEDKLMLLSYNSNGEITISKVQSYRNTVNLMQKIPILIEQLCRDDDWLNKMRDTGLKKLLFMNGYFDANTNKFYDRKTYGFNPNILFMDRISHSLEDLSDLGSYMDNIKKRLFYDTLGEVVGDYLIQQLSRALMGENMKEVLIGVGKTNTGKGVLSTALQIACGLF
jgi:hypothetical protein